MAADGFPVAVTCRVLEVPTSTYYEAIGRESSAREVEDRDVTGSSWRSMPIPGAPMGHRGCMPSYVWGWVFGHRLRAAGLLGSMGRVASRVDNAHL